MQILLKLYPQKVLLAWLEAIKGNKEITKWLLSSQFKELGIFTFALYNDSSARKWLLEQHFLWVIAFLDAIESDDEAVKWLLKSEYKSLAPIARAADNDPQAEQLILKNKNAFEISLYQEIRKIKNYLQARHDAPQNLGFD